MSVSPKGQYTNFVVFDEAKRYYVLQAQRNRPLLDEEVRELNQSLLAQVSRLTTSLMGDVAAPQETFSTPPASAGPNNAFKVKQSASPVNNFTITGGAGIDDPAILFLDGYRLFLKGSLEFEEQSAMLLPGEALSDAMKRDNYTKSAITGLTTPGTNRTDVVYVDLSFAEVTADTAGSEYTDPSIKDPVIGTGTANRLRAVIDIRVKEGWTGTTDAGIFDDAFFDPTLDNQIQHYKCPIALIRRTAGNQLILDSMVTDLLELHDKRVYTPKELTHRTRHGGYTQADVLAGRANASDVSETWGATGRNEGFDTESLNTSAVTPRTVDKSGKFKIRGLVVDGASDSVQPDAEILVSGEAVAVHVYSDRISAGYDTAFLDTRGETGGIIQASSVNSDLSAIHARAVPTGDAIMVRNGITGGTVNLHVKGDGSLGIKTGITGPLREVDVMGSGRFSANMEIGGNENISGTLGVTGASYLAGQVTVGGSGLGVIGDFGVTGKSFLAGQVTVGGSGLGVIGDFGVTGKSYLAGQVTVGGSGLGVVGDFGVTGKSYLAGQVTIGGSGVESLGDLTVDGKSTLVGYATVGGSGLGVLGDLGVTGKTYLGGRVTVGGSGMGVIGDLGVNGEVTLNGTVNANGDVWLNGQVSLVGSMDGQDFHIPGGPLSSTDPAIFGSFNVALPPDTDFALYANRGVVASGSTGKWGSFLSGANAETALVVGGGNTEPGAGPVSALPPSFLSNITTTNLLKKAVSVAVDPRNDNVYVGIASSETVGATSVVYVDRYTGAAKVVASGVRYLSSLSFDDDGILWGVTSLSSLDNNNKLYRFTPEYVGSSTEPSFLTVEPLALDTDLASVVGVCAVRDTIVVGANTIPPRMLILASQDGDNTHIHSVDPRDGTTVHILALVNPAGVKGVACGVLGLRDPAIYFISGTSATYVQSLDSAASLVYEGVCPESIETPRSLHLGLDGMLYISAYGFLPNAGKVYRMTTENIYETVYSGIDGVSSICVDRNRQMYLVSYPLGSLYRRPVPGSVVVRMDKPAVGSSYAFPGDVPLVTDAKFVMIEAKSADVVSLRAPVVQVDAKMDVTQDAFFEKDVYVSGHLHQDAFSTGELSAGSISIGATGACNALDVWGDTVISRMLVVGTAPCGTVAAGLVHQVTTTSGTTVGQDVMGVVFGEFQAYDYRAVGQNDALGIYSVESNDGHLAAWLGGDPVAPYQGDSGTSGGVSGGTTGRIVGMHLIEADTFVFDKNAGDDAAFVQVMGDMEVVRELSVRSIRHTALGPEGVEVRQYGAVSADPTRLLLKDFAMTTPTMLRGEDVQFVYKNSFDGAPGFTNYTGWSYDWHPEIAGCDVAYERTAPAILWQSSNIAPWGPDGSYGYTGTVYTWDIVQSLYTSSGEIFSAGVIPTEAHTDGTITRIPGPKSLDRIVLARLGEIHAEYKGCVMSGLDISTASARNILVSYGFSSDTLVGAGVTQDWLGAANYYPSTVTVRADLIERSGIYGYAESHHIQKSFQVYISPDSWYATKKSIGTPDYYTLYLTPGEFTPSSITVKGLENCINRAWMSRDAAVGSTGGNPLVQDASTDPFVTSSFEFQTERNAIDAPKALLGYPQRSSDWMLALYPSMKSAYKKLVGTSGDFNWVCTWDLEVSLVPMKEKQVSSVVGQLAIADVAGTPAWSSTTPPWTMRADLPWVNPSQVLSLVSGDKQTFEQSVAATTWTINHNLGGFPTVSVLSSSGLDITGAITAKNYLSPDALTITFASPTTGTAVLN